MIVVRDVFHSFPDVPVLKGVSFSLPTGEIAGIIGPSGGGKSVLLKIIGKVLAPQSGSINYGTPNEDSSDNLLGEEGVSLMFQEGALFDSLSVFDNIAFPLVQGRVPSMTLGISERREVHDRVQEILARVGLSAASQKMPAQLSGGMRRRVSLARALVARPKILLLDDPTSGLDPVASAIIMRLIADLHSEYKPTTLLVSQDLRRLLPCVREVFALFDGKIIFSGSLEELMREGDPRVKSFIACRYDCGADSQTLSPV